jgi:large subunit ribosomal protein L25
VRQLTYFVFSGTLPRDMQHAQIEAKIRTIHGRKTNDLRSEGSIPAVMYGFETEPKNITLDRNAFVKVYHQAGESTVVDLSIDGTSHPVLISEIQRDPLTDFITHADFRRVDPKRKIEASIPLKLIGVAPAVKELGGTLLQSLEEIEVMSLPGALVHEIEVDVTRLATFDDVIRVSDVVVPEGIEVRSDIDQAVASVQPPRSEAEMAALDAAVEADVSQVEVLSEKKDAPEGEGAAKAE